MLFLLGTFSFITYYYYARRVIFPSLGMYKADRSVCGNGLVFSHGEPAQIQLKYRVSQKNLNPSLACYCAKIIW